MTNKINLGQVFAVINELSKGKILHIPGYLYPLAMGEDYSIGFLYNDHIPCELNFSELCKLVFTENIIVIQK